jgi:hypothetical protein
MTDAERKRLVALLGMLGSNNLGERDNAARLAEEFRRQHGITWGELVGGKTIYVDRNNIVEREVVVERVVYVGLLRLLRRRRLNLFGWLRRLQIDRGIAIVLGGIPLVMLLAAFAPAIRAMLGY